MPMAMENSHSGSLNPPNHVQIELYNLVHCIDWQLVYLKHLYNLVYRTDYQLVYLKCKANKSSQIT